MDVSTKGSKVNVLLKKGLNQLSVSPFALLRPDEDPGLALPVLLAMDPHACSLDSLSIRV